MDIFMSLIICSRKRPCQEDIALRYSPIITLIMQ
jgi:hypothetical protein